MKWCSLGQHHAPETDFGRNRARRDGRQNNCRKCSNARRNAGRIHIYANQLERGVRIRDGAHLHRGMAELKARKGDPRPPGMQLSLIDEAIDSEDAYWGWHMGRPCALSTNPDHYCWETQAQNDARKAAQKALLNGPGTNLD